MKRFVYTLYLRMLVCHKGGCTRSMSHSVFHAMKIGSKCNFQIG